MERVAGGDDPRPERDRGATRAVRISGAVPALVGRADERVHLGEVGDALEHLGADHRVLLHLLVLGVGERARLVQDLAADRDLADVVEQRAVAQRALLLGAHAERLADELGELGDLAGVRGRVGILGLEGVGEDGDRAHEGALELRVELAAVDRGSNRGRDRLGEEDVDVAEAVILGDGDLEHRPRLAVNADRRGELRAAGAVDDHGLSAPDGAADDSLRDREGRLDVMDRDPMEVEGRPQLSHRGPPDLPLVEERRELDRQPARAGEPLMLPGQLRFTAGVRASRPVPESLLRFIS